MNELERALRLVESVNDIDEMEEEDAIYLLDQMTSAYTDVEVWKVIV